MMRHLHAGAPAGLLTTLLVATTLLAPATAVRAGQWIVPQWPDNREPLTVPVNLYGRLVNRSPLIYRTVVDVPAATNRATVGLRTRGHAYVYVDGDLVYRHDGDGLTDPRVAVNRIHWIELGPYLSPGRHVIAVSATGEGFVLDGGLYDETRRLCELGSSSDWTVTRCDPTAVVTAADVMNVDHDGAREPGVADAALPVRAVDTWGINESALTAAYVREAVAHAQKQLGHVRWRLGLLADRAIFVGDGRAWGWGGPLRAHGRSAHDADVMRADVEALETRLADLKGVPVTDADELRRAVPSLRRTVQDIEAMQAWVEQAGATAQSADDALAMKLAAEALSLSPAASPELQRVALTEKLGHAPGRLNESRTNPLGWLPMSSQADSDLSEWGIRVAPTGGTGRVRADREWMFSTDPDDVGLIEGRWRSLYPTNDRIWQPIRVPGGWAEQLQGELSRYKGLGWYRGSISIPSEWAGRPVRLKLTVGGWERLWVNNREVTDLGAGERKRTYILPPELIAFGGVTHLAVRVEAIGPYRGLIGEVYADCPAVEGESRDVPPVDVLSTPLSPAVVLRPRTNRLEIRHGGRAALATLRGGKMCPLASYNIHSEGPLECNWVLLWLRPGSPQDPRRPILLVFETNPQSIACETGITRLELGGPMQRVVAVRPWPTRDFSAAEGRVDLLTPVTTWSQLARAIPINYMNVSRVLVPAGGAEAVSTSAVPSGALVEQTIVYDYLEIEDDWDTPALKAAPLPPLCGLALEAGRSDLNVERAAELAVVQQGGPTGAWRVLPHSDSVRYTYHGSPWQRVVGVGASMDSPRDVPPGGVKREVELVASLGAGSFLVRHPWADERPTAGRRVDRDMTRLAVLAEDAWAQGLNVTSVAPVTFDSSPEIVTLDYAGFVDRLCEHNRQVAGQLADLPFHAAMVGLVDSPDHQPAGSYRSAMAEAAKAVRAQDLHHLVSVPLPPMELLKAEGFEPLEDPRVVYAFDGGTSPLAKPGDRWPADGTDLDTLCRAWWPVLVYSAVNGVPLHCSDYGRVPSTALDETSVETWLHAVLALQDQFGMHSHYRDSRDLFEVLADGSCLPTPAARTLGRYFQQEDPSRLVPPPQPWRGRIAAEEGIPGDEEAPAEQAAMADAELTALDVSDAEKSPSADEAVLPTGEPAEGVAEDTEAGVSAPVDPQASAEGAAPPGEAVALESN